MARVYQGQTVTINNTRFTVVKVCRGSGAARRAALKIAGAIYSVVQGQWVAITPHRMTTTETPEAPDYFYK